MTTTNTTTTTERNITMNTPCVTVDNWSVAFETGTGITGANLHVGIYVDDAPNDWGGRGVYYRHECYGMNFPTVEAAKQYAMVQGFLTPWTERSIDEIRADRQRIGIINQPGRIERKEGE